jgi:DNA-binding response OmpR family regulator
VDDDAANRIIARAALEKSGFEVGEAADGVQAVQVLELTRDYHLVVLDLNMPRMGGREVLSWIRKNPAIAATPVIVLTGSQDAEAEIELMEAGADDYIRKPLDPSRFLARVRATLRRAGAPA